MKACVQLLMCALLPAIVGPVGGEVVLTGGGGGAGGGGLGGGGPVFAPRQSTAVRAARGHSATLQCWVLGLGDKAVSWVRSRDLQILSHGGAVFTADARVSVPSSPNPTPTPPLFPSPSAAHTHPLTISRLRDSDAGRYECQLNTEPKMSLFFDLIVLDEEEAAAVLASSTEAAPEQVEGGGDASVSVWAVRGEVRAAAGGAAELACGARRTLSGAGDADGPLDIRWLRGGRPLVLEEGCSVSRLSEPAHAESVLRVARVGPRHGGRYACVAGGRSAYVRLLVGAGDGGTETVGEIEAMQRDESAGGGAGGALCVRAACLLVLLLAYITAL